MGTGNTALCSSSCSKSLIREEGAAQHLCSGPASPTQRKQTTPTALPCAPPGKKPGQKTRKIRLKRNLYLQVCLDPQAHLLRFLGRHRSPEAPACPFFLVPKNISKAIPKAFPGPILEKDERDEGSTSLPYLQCFITNTPSTFQHYSAI